MDFRRTRQRILGASLVLAVAWSGALIAAPFDKKATSSAPPAKAAPAQAKPAPVQRPVQPNVNRPAPYPTRNNPVHPTSRLTPRKPVDQPEPIKHQPQIGEQVKSGPGGRQEIHNPQTGRTVTTDARGEVRRIEAPRPGWQDGDQSRPPWREKVETGRPGARVVSYGPHRGFVERTVRPGYISRTYVVGGRSYAHVYREYRYHGIAYYRYVPGVYYGPRFYAWAAGTPWGGPVRYAWFGLATPAPWFRFYAGYFTPYPTYASADLWLTDYMLADNLRLAYENQQTANEGQAPPPPQNVQSSVPTLSPEMKALIADEVRQQLAAEKANAVQPTSSIPSRLPIRNSSRRR